MSSHEILRHRVQSNWMAMFPSMPGNFLIFTYLQVGGGSLISSALTNGCYPLLKQLLNAESKLMRSSFCPGLTGEFPVAFFGTS